VGPRTDGGDGTEGEWLAAASGAAAVWTLASRVAGFLRLAVVGAVLGPTYFGNLFQTVSIVPNVVHDLLSGALISALLVPSLVRQIGRDPRRLAALANGFLGVMLVVFGTVALLCMICAPLLLHFLTAAVADPDVRTRQAQLGGLLLLSVMPQLCLYGLAATAAAVQHAHRRFALAAAAPGLENIGIVAVLLASGVIFGSGQDVGSVTTAEVLFLGIGSTLAAAIHAGVQWWGARRVGVVLRPCAGWRDPEVRAILRLALPSSGNALLDSAAYVGLLVIAGSIPGGVVAFQIGFSFMLVPVALWARPLATAQLSRLVPGAAGDGATDAGSSNTYRLTLALASFVALPAACLFVAAPGPLAGAAVFGSMATVEGAELVAAAIGGLGLAIVGMAALHVATAASYARGDAYLPLRAMAIRTVIVMVGIVAAPALVGGADRLWLLGLSYSLGSLAAACYLHLRIAALLPASDAVIFRPARDLFAALVAAAVAAGLGAHLESGAPDGPHRFTTALVVLGSGATTYLLLQLACNSNELQLLVAVLRRPWIRFRNAVANLDGGGGG
jgi:putative peptidoglycan lipid II flippase